MGRIVGNGGMEMSDDNIVPIDPEAPYGRKKDGTPYKRSPETRAAWLSSVKATNDKPSNGVGKGDGWGGPASNMPHFERSPANLTPGPPTLAERQAKAYRDMTAQQVIESRKEKLFNLSENAEREETQLSATIALLNRLEGMPVSRSISATIDDLRKMGEDELRAEHDRLTRAIASSGA